MSNTWYTPKVNSGLRSLSKRIDSTGLAPMVFIHEMVETILTSDNPQDIHSAVSELSGLEVTRKGGQG